jgi:citrate lyase beta subunit
MIAKNMRSILFTPALRMDRFKQALELDTDICLLDCEDSVGFRDKDNARNNICDL